MFTVDVKQQQHNNNNPNLQLSDLFQGTQERVRNSRAISVRATEVLLYAFPIMSWHVYRLVQVPDDRIWQIFVMTRPVYKSRHKNFDQQKADFLAHQLSLDKSSISRFYHSRQKNPLLTEIRPIWVFAIRMPFTSQQAHGVEMTSYLCRCDVMTSHQC